MSNIYVPKKIIFVGYMASGKSTIGQLLSYNLSYELEDTDRLIEEKCKSSVSEIFKNEGELFFRKIEHQVFDELINNENEIIISTGGGLPCYFNNHDCLKLDHVLSIYLKYQPQTLVNRLIEDKSNRPIVEQIGEKDLIEFVSKHLFERNYYYMQAKHIFVCDNKSIDEIVDECMGLVHSL